MVVRRVQGEVVSWELGLVKPVSFKVTLLAAVVSEEKAELTVRLFEESEQVSEELRVDPTGSQVTEDRVNSEGIVR